MTGKRNKIHSKVIRDNDYDDDVELYSNIKSSSGGAIIGDTAYRNQIKSNIGFCEEGKTRVPRGKALGAEWITNKLNPHLMLSLGMKLGCIWWKASAPTSLPIPCSPHFILFIYLIASTEHGKTRSPYEHSPYLHKHAPYLHKHM